MILSNDTINLKPPYKINPNILQLITAISEKIGAINSTFLTKASPQLRKQNQIKTIQSSLRIDGNTLSIEQISALMDNKSVIGPTKDILEVQNAIAVYEQKANFKVNSLPNLLKAHNIICFPTIMPVKCLKSCLSGASLF